MSPKSVESDAATSPKNIASYQSVRSDRPYDESQ
jgi:hypothetical protein